MFEALKRVQAWVPIDGTHDLGPGPRSAPEDAGDRLQAVDLHDLRLLPRGLPAGPRRERVHRPRGDLAGAPLQLHPTGEMNQDERLEAASGAGGIQDCGNAQNCVRVCPKEIPLTDSIAAVNRALTKRGIFGLLRR